MSNWRRVFSIPETYQSSSGIDDTKADVDNQAQVFHQEDHLDIHNDRDGMWGETDYRTGFPAPSNENVVQKFDQKYPNALSAGSSLKLSWNIPYDKKENHWNKDLYKENEEMLQRLAALGYKDPRFSSIDKGLAKEVKLTFSTDEDEFTSNQIGEMLHLIRKYHNNVRYKNHLGNVIMITWLQGAINSITESSLKLAAYTLSHCLKSGHFVYQEGGVTGELTFLFSSNGKEYEKTVPYAAKQDMYIAGELGYNNEEVKPLEDVQAIQQLSMPQFIARGGNFSGIGGGMVVREDDIRIVAYRSYFTAIEPLTLSSEEAMKRSKSNPAKNFKPGQKLHTSDGEITLTEKDIAGLKKFYGDDSLIDEQSQQIQGSLKLEAWQQQPPSALEVTVEKVKKVIAWLNDVMSQATDEDELRMYRGDIRSYKALLRYLSTGEIERAQKWYSDMDTAARDFMFEQTPKKLLPLIKKTLGLEEDDDIDDDLSGFGSLKLSWDVQKKVKFKGYTGPAGPSLDQATKNDKALIQAISNEQLPLHVEFFMQKAYFPPMKVLKITNKKGQEVEAAYDRWGYVVEGEYFNKTGEDFLDQCDLKTVMKFLREFAGVVKKSGQVQPESLVGWLCKGTPKDWMPAGFPTWYGVITDIGREGAFAIWQKTQTKALEEFQNATPIMFEKHHERGEVSYLDEKYDITPIRFISIPKGRKKGSLHTNSWTVIPDEINTYNDFKRLVENAEINKYYKIPNFYFESVVVDHDDNGYSWVLSPNYKLSGGSVRIVTPGSGNMITFWKKPENAKKNLLNYMSQFFDEETGEYTKRRSSLQLNAWAQHPEQTDDELNIEKVGYTVGDTVLYTGERSNVRDTLNDLLMDDALTPEQLEEKVEKVMNSLGKVEDIDYHDVETGSAFVVVNYGSAVMGADEKSFRKINPTSSISSLKLGWDLNVDKPGPKHYEKVEDKEPWLSSPGQITSTDQAGEYLMHQKKERKATIDEHEYRQNNFIHDYVDLHIYFKDEGGYANLYVELPNGESVRMQSGDYYGNNLFGDKFRNEYLKLFDTIKDTKLELTLEGGASNGERPLRIMTTGDITTQWRVLGLLDEVMKFWPEEARTSTLATDIYEQLKKFLADHILTLNFTTSIIENFYDALELVKAMEYYWKFFFKVFGFEPLNECLSYLHSLPPAVCKTRDEKDRLDWVFNIAQEVQRFWKDIRVMASKKKSWKIAPTVQAYYNDDADIPLLELEFSIDIKPEEGEPFGTINQTIYHFLGEKTNIDWRGERNVWLNDGDSQDQHKVDLLLDVLRKQLTTIYSSLKLSSEDPAFDDYSKTRGLNLMQYEKDVPGGADALEGNQSYQTDFFLPDLQHMDKEISTEDWNGKENLQLGM